MKLENGYDTSLEYQSETQTLVGTRRKEYMDMDTGEHIFVDQISKRIYGTRNFWKCYLMDFLMVLGIIDSKQLDIFIYIVENTNQSNNIFIGTYEKISKDVGCSSATISRILKKLQEHNFIKKVQNGVWLVNPNILMKGNDTKRQILLSYYESDTPLEKITLKRTNKDQEVVLEAEATTENPQIFEAAAIETEQQPTEQPTINPTTGEFEGQTEIPDIFDIFPAGK